jgi:dimethylargininase
VASICTVGADYSSSLVIAFTRTPSAALAECELTFLAREPIDVSLALRQHRAYESGLQKAGARIERLPDMADLPDAPFVEDTAVVLDEVAVIASMAAASRRREIDSVVPSLSKHRPVKRLSPPAFLDGGDVLRVGRELFIGVSTRTNHEAVRAVADIVREHGYTVTPVEVSGCLHLKTGCSRLSDRAVLIDSRRIPRAPFRHLSCVDVPEGEEDAANVLVIDRVAVMPSGYPRTTALLIQQGLVVEPVDLSEFQKAEAGATCLSLMLSSVSP